MKPKITIFNNGCIALWIFANVLFFQAIAAAAIADTADKQYFADSSLLAAAAETGLNGTVNAQELTSIMYLGWPQQYISIIRRFGMPYSRDRYRDFYKIAGARNWVAILYGEDGRARGYIIISGD